MCYVAVKCLGERCLSVALVLSLMSSNAALAWQVQFSAPLRTRATGPGAAQATDKNQLPGEAPRELTPPSASPVEKTRRNDTAGAAFIDDAGSSPATTVNLSGAGPPSGSVRTIRRGDESSSAAGTAARPATTIRPTIEAAKMSGVQPGTSKLRDLQAAWGEPQKVDKYEAYIEHTYHLEPFQRVTVTLVGETVTSMVVYLQDKFPAEAVTRQLDLAEIEPVLITGDDGEVLGQAFPERGVLFSFEPGVKEYLVSQILLRPIEFQPFALRAEVHLQTRYAAALSDLDHALQLNPQYARGHWLHAQLLMALGRFDQAHAAITKGLQLEADNAEFRLTRAEIWQHQSQYARALEETKAVLAQAGLAPLVRARALLQLAGQFANVAQRDYHAAVERRQEAIELLQPLAADTQPAVRRAVKELLIEAHLATAHDVAWGAWNRKAQVVPKWLQEGESLAQEAIAAGDGDETLIFRVAQQALSALAGMKSELDPTAWVASSKETGHALIEATSDPLSRRQRQWSLALALYDAVQIYHARGQAEPALQCGREAIDLLQEASQGTSLSPLESFLTGRLYFRFGAAHAVLAGQHAIGVQWFEKAIPLINAGGKSQPLEAGKQGEALVSMAISYWETGDQSRALQLTTSGAELMQTAVRDGILDEAALTIAYNNLAIMHRQMGDSRNAQRFAQLATRTKASRQ